MLYIKYKGSYKNHEKTSYSFDIYRNIVWLWLENQWIGKDFDRFVLKYGSPYKKFNLLNGDVLYTWNSGVSSVNIPQLETTSVYGNTVSTQIYGVGSIKLYCEIQLQVSSKGFIKKLTILKDTLKMSQEIIVNPIMAAHLFAGISALTLGIFQVFFMPRGAKEHKKIG